MFVVAALYKFAPVEDPAALRDRLDALCESAGLQGTLLVAPEGLNGTVAGPREGIDALLDALRALEGFEDLHAKESECVQPPFLRMKVRLKREIVTMGDAEIDPRERVGTYVPPEAWNELIADPNVILIDTRNDYEVRIGTFDGAVDPKIKTFRDFPAWVKDNLDPGQQPKVAMFCTGGIRCEKASSLLLREGFEEVYHLEGGILAYLRDVPEAQSTWNGECFVFDRRVALDHHSAPGNHELCYGCQEPVSPEDMARPEYEAGVCCHRCAATIDEATKARRRERLKQLALAESRGEVHLGAATKEP